MSEHQDETKSATDGPTHQPAIILDDTDTVVTMLEDADAGDIPDGTDLELEEPVAFGHKVSLVECDPGEEIRKYGEVIGIAIEPISPGEWVHTHNCDSVRGKAEVTE